MTHAHVGDLETRLVQAVVADTLTLHYQPVVALPSGRPIAVEALARWSEPDLGNVPPDVFIPVAERTGLIHRLGRQVLEQACAAAAAWQPGRASAPHVAVNVSPLQLADASFVAHVSHALDSSGLAPERLVLEITESAAIADLRESATRLLALRSLGVRVALDDFGIGHSPLSMLKHLPIDILKIDRSFVTRVHENARDAVIVRLLVDTAHTLGLTVCGEGVESPEQARQLLAVGCDTAQGWHFGRPVPDSPELAAALDPEPGRLPTVDPGTAAPIQIGSEEVVTILSPDAQVLYASPGSLAVLGYTPSQLIGGSAVQHLHPDEREDVLTAMRQADAAPSTRTHRVRHSDGDFRWLRTRAQLLRDGDGAPSEIVATSRDVTAQVEAQQQLQNIGSTLGWAFDRSPFGMALSDFDGAIVRTNRAFAAMLGYEAGELVGRRVRELTYPDDVPADERNLHHLLAEHQGTQRVRKRYLHRDGKPVPAHVWATALDDDGGRPAYVVAHILPAGADE